MIAHTHALRAILFDLDGTLYRQGLLRGFMVLELSTLPFETGRVGAAARTLRVLRCFRMVREELRREPDAGVPLVRLQYEMTGERTGVPSLDVEHLVAEWMYRRPLKYLRYCRRRGVESFLAQMSHGGIRVGVFSDYPVQDKLEAMGLSGSISLALCATDPEINAFKPHPRGFLRACELWGLRSEEVLYVGDRLDVDAAGAAAAGMPCAILTGSVKRLQPLTCAADNVVTFTSFQGLAHVLNRNH